MTKEDSKNTFLGNVTWVKTFLEGRSGVTQGFRKLQKYGDARMNLFYLTVKCQIYKYLLSKE